MKTLIIICVLVGLLAHSSEGVNCVCKCCNTDGCDSSKAEPQSFDLSGVCSAATCNRLTCSAKFQTCPIPTSAGHVDSTCDANAIQTPLITLSALLIGTFMAWKLY